LGSKAVRLRARETGEILLTADQVHDLELRQRPLRKEESR
jgi:hypothetical protein